MTTKTFRNPRLNAQDQKRSVAVLKQLRRTLLSFEPLEDRICLDTKTFAGLDFIATNKFTTSPTLDSVSGNVVVEVHGIAKPLLTFSNGVSFNPANTTGQFTPIGTVSASENSSSVPILNGMTHAPWTAFNLLPGGAGVTIAAAETAGLAPISVNGVNFADSSVQISGTTSAPTGVQMQGSVTLPQLGTYSFSLASLPQKTYVLVGSAGVSLGANFDVTLSNQSFTKGGLSANLQSLEVKYTLATQEFDLRGVGTITLPSFKNPVAIHVGASATPTDYGIQVVAGQLTKFVMQVENTNSQGSATGLSIGSVSVTPQSLQVTYAKTTDTSGNTHNTYTVSGGASFTPPKSTTPVLVQLGTTAANGEPATQGIVVTDSTLTNFDMLIDGSTSGTPNAIKIGSLSVTPTSLHFVYTQSTNTYSVTGGGMFTLPKATSPITVQLGSPAANGEAATQGIVVVAGALTTFNMSISSGTLKVGSLSVTNPELDLSYTQSSDTYTVTGTGMFTLPKSTSPIAVALGSPAANGEAATQGIVVTAGALTTFNMSISAPSITAGKLTVTNPNLDLSYSQSSDTYTVTGGGMFMLPDSTSPVAVQLGSPAANGMAATQGIVVAAGVLTTFNMSISTSSLTIGKVAFTQVGLDLSYTQSTDSNNLSHTGYSVYGSAEFTVGTLITTPILVDFGTSATPGLVVEDGSLTEFNLQLSTQGTPSPIKFGSLTLTPISLGMSYTQSTNTYAISGAASFQIANLMSAPITVQLGSPAVAATATAPALPATQGLVITNGTLTNLDLSVDDTDSSGKPISFAFDKLTITPTDLHFLYVAGASGTTFGFSGGLGISLVTGGETESISLALTDQTVNGQDMPGLVITNGNLTSFNATVTADFDFKRLKIGIQAVTLSYVSATSSFALDGTIMVSVTGTSQDLVNVSATFGDIASGETDHGLVISNGQLQSLYIVVNGGFSLKGLSVQAKDLLINYSSSANELQLSGGVDVQLGPKLDVNAMIGASSPLIIDATTGDLSVDPTKGLMISGGLTLGSFSAMAMLDYTQTAQGLDLSADVMVDLPQGIDVMGSFSIVDGHVDSISLSYTGMIAVGTTGFFVTKISGSVSGLASPGLDALSVSGSMSVTFGKTITIAGHTEDLLDATGSFTIDTHHLDLMASVNLVGGYLGTGTAEVDINWSTGTFMVDGSISLLDNFVTISGSLFLDTQGDVTFQAMASINIPNGLPFAGTSLASVNLLLNLRPNDPNPNDSFVAAWGSIFIIGTVGVRYDFNSGSFQFINSAPSPTPITPPTNYTYTYMFPITPTDPNVTQYDVTVTSPLFANSAYNAPIYDGYQASVQAYGTTFPAADFTVSEYAVNPGYSVNGHAIPPAAMQSSTSRTIELPVSSIAKIGSVVSVGGISATLTSTPTTGLISVQSATSLIDSNGNTPMFSVTPEYALPKIVSPTAVASASNTKVNFQLTATDSIPASAMATPTVTLYYQNSSDTKLHDGTVIGTFMPSKGLTSTTVGTGTDLSLNYTWSGLTDLANTSIPYNTSPQPSFEFYASITDGVNPVQFQTIAGPPLIPPNPVPTITTEQSTLYLTTTPYASLPNESAGQKVPLGLTSSSGLFSATQAAPLTFSVAVSVDQGGYFADGTIFSSPTLPAGATSFSLGNFTSSSLPNTTVTAPEFYTPSLAACLASLQSFNFVTSGSYTGSSDITLTVTDYTADGTAYTSTVDIPVVVPNADLYVTSSIVNVSNSVDDPDDPIDQNLQESDDPSTGGIVTLEVDLQNSPGPNNLPATNVALQEDLPDGVTFIEATVNQGSYNADTGIWTVGTLQPGSTVTMMIEVQIDAGTLGTDLDATASAYSSTSDIYPDDATDDSAFHAVDAPFQLNNSIEALNGAVGAPFTSYQFQLAQDANGVVEGGAGGPYTYAAIPDPYGPQEGYIDGLPPGLTLSSDGLLTGTPTVPGVYDAFISVTDGVGSFTTTDYVINVASQPPLTVGVFTDANGGLQALPAGAINASYTITSGSLPPGLQYLNQDGYYVDAPTTPGFYTFTVQEQYYVPPAGSTPSTSTSAYVKVTPSPVTISLLVNNSPGSLAVSLPTGILGQSFPATQFTTLNASHQTIPNSQVMYSVSNGALPPGLTLTPAGILEGTPTNFGSGGGGYGFTVEAQDSSGNILATGSYDLNVNVPSSPIALPEAFVGLAYGNAFTATGNPDTTSGDYFFYTLAPGSSLPAGITLTADGLAGTASTAGTYAFTIEESPVGGLPINVRYSLTVAQPFSITTTTLRTGVENTPYAQAIATTGGTGLFITYAVTSGGLPDGLTLGLLGSLSGTPTQTGEFPVTITATDAVGASISQDYTLKVTSLAIGTAGFSYSQTLSDHIFTSTSELFTSSKSLIGSPIPGLQLSTGGTLSGTPTTAGLYTITVQDVETDVIDRSTQTFFDQYTVLISAPLTLPATINFDPGDIIYSYENGCDR